MADTRYLKRRGQRWYFQLAVPADVQPSYGRRVVLTALGTADLRRAQRLRWDHLKAAHDAFDRLRGRKPLTGQEIEAAAGRYFDSILTHAEERRQKGGALALADPETDPETGQPASTPEVAGLEIMLGETVEALRDDAFAPVEAEAAAAIAEAGATVEHGSDRYLELCRALLWARAEALRGLIAHRQGQPYEPERPFNRALIDPLTLRPAAAPAVKPRRFAGNGLRVSEAVERYVAERTRDPAAKWTGQTLAQYRTTFRLFQQFTGDMPLAAVTRTEAAEFLDTLGSLRQDWARQPGAVKLTLAELLERYQGEPGLTNKTLNRYVTALNGLFKWARHAGLYEGDGPFSGQMRRTGRRAATGWLPFTVEELNTLFGSALFRETPREQRVRPRKHSMRTALLWLPLLGLFTGARSGELCQLRVEDVRSDQGVWHLDIRDDGDGQRVKTAAAVRKVPVHSQLIAAGFLEYVDWVRSQGHERLFPALKPGGPDGKLNWYFTRAFGMFRERLGVERPRIGFHSFRKNVATALERARVPESEAVQVLGHEKLSMSYSVYSLGLDLPHLRDVVEKVSFTGLDLSHLTVSGATRQRRTG